MRELPRHSARVLACFAALWIGASSAPVCASDYAWLELSEPVDGAEHQGSIALLEVRGRAGLGSRAPLDVVLLIDLSESTLLPSGIDVDGDGRVGRLSERGYTTVTGQYRPIRAWTTDAGDTVVRGEIESARRLLLRLRAGRSRAGIVTFAGRGSPRADVGPVDRALAALGDVRVRLDKSGTNLGAGIRAAIRLLLRAPEIPGRERRPVIIVLSDGEPTVPRPRIHARSYAVSAAERARDHGIRIFGFAMGQTANADPHVLREVADITHGEFLQAENMGEVLSHLPYSDLAGIDDVTIRNETTGSLGRGTRVFADGSFDGFVPLAPGRNVIEVRARSADGEELRTQRTVSYAAAPASEEDLVRMGELHEELRARAIELELAGKARRQQRERRVRVTVEP